MNITNHSILKLKQIKLLILDVDGVLTDGTIYFDKDGNETKGFNTQDGLGLKRIQQQTNISIAVISGKRSPAVEHRLRGLSINHVYLGIKDKFPIYQQLLNQFNIQPNTVAYVGDDLPDAEIMSHTGLSIAVNNAVDPIKEIADITTQRNGGNGAVREVCELLIKAQI